MDRWDSLNSLILHPPYTHTHTHTLSDVILWHMLQPSCFGTDNICPDGFPIPNPCHFSPCQSLCVFVPRLAGSRWQQLPQHQMGHCQEVMRGKHLPLRRTPLLHFQPFDTTYAGTLHAKPSDRDENSSRQRHAGTNVWHCNASVGEVSCLV